jgi:AmiR/NasT family two-component response regulator
MERHKLDAEGAFQMLVHASQDTNLKLTKVATWLTGNTTAEPPAAS